MGKAASAAEVAALAKKYGKTTDQVLSEIKGSSYKYGDKVLRNNAARAAGTYSTAKSPNYTKEINKIYDPLYEAADASLAANKAGLNDEFANLSERLRETARKSEQGLTESMNRYGLLESGRTAAGIGKIQSDLASDINKSDIQRTIQEANMVLENAQYKSNLGLQKLQATMQTDPLGIEQQKVKMAQDLQAYGLNIQKFSTIAELYSKGVLNSWKTPDQGLYNLLLQFAGGK